MTESRTYNAANQVVGWTYDAAGNLTSDGTQTYSYDALGRMTSTTKNATTTSNTYNGDGVLVAQVNGTTTMRYTQDLLPPLSQVLQQTVGTTKTDYVYGHERLFAQEGTARTWYAGDGLGSVRRTLSDTAGALSGVYYDPWGTPQYNAEPPTFGYTGELQDASMGLVHLRARWYQPGNGTLLGRDPFAGYDQQPYREAGWPPGTY